MFSEGKSRPWDWVFVSGTISPKIGDKGSLEIAATVKISELGSVLTLDLSDGAEE